jgi:hypothetical protein
MEAHRTFFSFPLCSWLLLLHDAYGVFVKKKKTEILMREGREKEKKWEVCVCANFRHQIC